MTSGSKDSESARPSLNPDTQDHHGLPTAPGVQIRIPGSGTRSSPNTRPLEPTEEDMLIVFESHAQGCATCKNISKLYSERKDLCGNGYRFAAQILRHLHMRSDGSVHQLRTIEDLPQEVDIPDVLPLSLELLRTVERSSRDPTRDRPFVSNQPSLGPKGRSTGYTLYNVEVSVSIPNRMQQTFDRIYVWSDPASELQRFEAPVPTLHLIRGTLLIQPGEVGNKESLEPTTRLSLSPRSKISVHAGIKIVVLGHSDSPGIEHSHEDHFTLEFRSQSDCEILLTRLKHAAENLPTSVPEAGASQEAPTSGAGIAPPPPIPAYTAIAEVFQWSQATERWETLDHEKLEATLSIRPGSLEILFPLRDPSRLKLTSYSIIKEHSTTGIIVDRVTTAGDTNTGLGHWKSILLRFRSYFERDAVATRLRQAAGSSGRPPTPVFELE